MHSKRRYHQPTSLRVTMGGKRAAEQESSGKGNSAGCPGCRDAVVPRLQGSSEPWASLAGASPGQASCAVACETAYVPNSFGSICDFGIKLAE